MPQQAEIPEQSIVTFPEGIPGFEKSLRFVIVKPADLEPLLLLQEVDGAGLSLPVIPVQCVRGDYPLRVGAEDRRLLGLDDEPTIGGNVICLAVLVVRGNGESPTCNLNAPMVINPVNRRGKQVPQHESDLPTAYPLKAD